MSSADLAHAAALHTLYSDHHHWLTGWLRRRLCCPQNAADLAQDTFVKVLVSRQAVRIDEPRAFLTTIARRVLCNHYRRQDVERAYLEALASLPEREVPSEETRAIVLETLVELDRLLDGLPPLAKETFLLAQLDGLGYAEIATQLDISLSSVKRYMLKAAQRCYFAELP
ncbi:TPA: sigma-70 family RNA polymerase sigma factor [Pseudomonas aeruginosa]|uniref:sigma-70 family RNA polymerase sigma factor n=1 Tax=Pseudomonas aeruginosa TaxID=287 RepID=UPI001ADF68E2|nr:sigma-70 family RNA polymerase sigma factor [Pseudomonas aeruginosa]MDI3951865.1 sigma-70 family RNA polymerase sigma factor [Pseudomonas aeruginosa]MDV7958692.1 sigma-70 family RNA polymerase sigma factor [Pseudomonas aeruginosa]HBO9439418.1 sigma-70 family RNA polymerase sigma factor [Pseudomonas aeruginosa]HBO9517901.1 sigma-70 family RNA polymerase sigma factor [Pseudomonas aeruginosa]HBO9653796.1 sigma-70 family RNA polymerase sigma factor [Pseudomonas aeruginosa]